MKNRLWVVVFVILAFVIIQTGCNTGDSGPVSTEGFTTTDSGLQYKVVKEGTGKKPGPYETVEVHYEGKLLDGTVFDSSYERKGSITFRLSQVIKGWGEGLQLMAEGAVYHFIIPPELAYGDKSAGSLITPNSTLWFKVELIDVK